MRTNFEKVAFYSMRCYSTPPLLFQKALLCGENIF